MPEPPIGGDAVDPALAVQAGEHRRRAAPHDVHRPAAIGVADEVGVVGARRARDLLAGDVGGDERLAEHARVDEQDVDPASRSRSRTNAYSWPFVSRVPSSTTVAISAASTPSQRRCASGSCASSDAVVSAAI